MGTVRDERLYARGAADDKGQLWIHVTALEACLTTRGALPINVVMLIEGEEEVGSTSLPGFLATHHATAGVRLHRHLGHHDVCARTCRTFSLPCAVWPTSRSRARSAPTDLHSGQYGGVVANAAMGLARAVSTLLEANGRVAIPGFYDDVREPSPTRRQEMARLPFNEGLFASDIGIGGLTGEDGYGPLERIWLRPTCEVNGIVGGYTGEGAKTVIPSAALAKVSFRLVPDQTPERVERLLRDHLARLSDSRGEHGAPAPSRRAPVERGQRHGRGGGGPPRAGDRLRA